MKNTKSRTKKKKVRAKTKKIVRVLAMGTFDLLHPGHIFYLSHAKKAGDVLNVIVARDQNVMRIKGKRPTLDEKSRVLLVDSLKMVDRAILGNKKDIFAKVKELNPHVIVMGYDQRPSNEIVERELRARGMRIIVRRAPAYQNERFKSSKIKKKILRGFHQKIST